MRQRIITAVKLLAFGAACFGVGYAVEFWFSPAGEPLCVARGADAVRAFAYTVLQDVTHQGWYWFVIGAVCMIPLCGIWRQLWRIANNRLGG